MNRFLIPLLILLGSFLYSWFWNCNENRRPTCFPEVEATMESVSPAIADEPVVEEITEAEQIKEVEELLFTPLDVYFEVNKLAISRTEEVNNFLSTAKTYLAAHPDKKLSVTGHSDSDGSAQSNQVLSENRAKQVKDLLVADGFAENQLVVIGKGENEPVVPNDSPENKARNRRFSVRLMN